MKKLLHEFTESGCHGPKGKLNQLESKHIHFHIRVTENMIEDKEGVCFAAIFIACFLKVNRRVVLM